MKTTYNIPTMTIRIFSYESVMTVSGNPESSKTAEENLNEYISENNLMVSNEIKLVW